MTILKANGRLLKVGERFLSTTPGEAPTPPDSLKIGDAYGGGYYLADFIHNENIYRLVLAPKASETSMQWDDWTHIFFSYTTDHDDGPTNTAQLTAHQYLIAEYCVGYRGGDHTDWYLPAANELIAMMPNIPLLPSSEAVGISPDSSTHLWSSTEDTQYHALKVEPATGLSYSGHKNDLGLVRPVRRVHIGWVNT